MWPGPAGRRFFGEDHFFMLRDMTKRIFTLLRTAARVMGGAVVDRACHSHSDRSALLAQRVRRAFEELGPTFLKAGQLMSSTTGPLPKVWVDEMSHCRDDVPPAPWASVSGVISDELGDRLDVFASIDPSPLAAGSMAQVHAARLIDGTPVVVKVQRPGLAKVLSDDVRLLRLAARVAARVSSACAAANAVALVDDFAAGLWEQISFRTEAANASRMAEAVRSLPVRVPAVYESLTTERVLVMERFDGVNADDESIENRSAVVDAVVSALLVPALRDGVFHADMHPGNLQVLDDGQLGLLDFGVLGYLDDPVRSAAADLLEALVERRFGDMVLAMFEIVDPAGVDLVRLLPEVQSLVSNYLDKPLAEVDIRGAVAGVLSLASRAGFALPESLMAFFKQMVFISGMCQKLDPTFDLLADLVPILRRARAAAPVAA